MNLSRRRETPRAVSVRAQVYSGALVLGLLLGAYGWIVMKHSGGDFHTLYLAGARLMHGGNIYWSPPEVNPQSQCPPGLLKDQLDQIRKLSADTLINQPICVHPNLNPPFFIVLSAPLAKLAFEPAWLLWFTFSITCLWSVIALLWREDLLAKSKMALGLQVAASMLYMPTLVNLVMGQVTFQTMLPMMLGWAALRHRHDRSAGVWLGLAVSLKPFLGLILVGLVFQRNYRAASAMVVMGLICGLIGCLAGGLSIYQDYVDALGSVNWHAASWNASLAGFFSRPFGGSQNVPWIDAPWLARGLTWVASLMVLNVYLKLMWRMKDLDAVQRADWLLATSVPAMLLISPLGWIYYFPMLLPGTLIMWRSSQAVSFPGPYRKALLCSLILSSVPGELILAREINHPLEWFGPSGFYAVALVQLFMLACMAAPRNPAGFPGQHSHA